ncbi:MAG: Na(+)/H(+) antiporter subunit D [Pseudomonadota bacterium]|nr:Na(+)/H(+) antiporter subunit D [Pseudomonadota bacterium]
MTDIFLHPAIPIFIGSLLIFIFKDKENLISIGSLLVALYVLVFITDEMSLTYTLTSLGVDNQNYLSLNYFSYSQLGFFFCLVYLIIGILGKLFSIYRDNYIEKALILIYIGSSVSVIFSGDFITFYIFWELMAIASTFIIWSANTNVSYHAGTRYLLIHLLGGIILLIGIVGLSINTQDLALRNLQGSDWYNWLILIGLLLNAGAPPLSSWIPDAYPEASYSSTVFLSAYTTKTSVFALIVIFAGTQILIYIGLYMIMYGIIYALLENDIRRILAYSIVNQVGFMVVGIGIGTELSLNGSASHAFAHIIYKGLLLMSAGSVIYITQKRKCTDVGGLYKVMPLTTVCAIIGALSISAFPLTSGFISKSMITDASYQQGLEFVWFMLLVGSAGVFLHAGIKFPWFVFFNKDKNIIASDPPIYMKSAMILSSFLCILIGVFPNLLYGLLPFNAMYLPYTWNHVISQTHLLLFSGLAFFVSLKYLERKLTITLDFDWFYRKGNTLSQSLITHFLCIMKFLKEKISELISYEKFIKIENYLIKQNNISIMITIVLIIFTLFLILNLN